MSNQCIYLSAMILCAAVREPLRIWNYRGGRIISATTRIAVVEILMKDKLNCENREFSPHQIALKIIRQNFIETHYRRLFLTQFGLLKITKKRESPHSIRSRNTTSDEFTSDVSVLVMSKVREVRRLPYRITASQYPLTTEIVSKSSCQWSGARNGDNSTLILSDIHSFS